MLGASLLSAAASLPSHLMPFLVAAVVSESRLPLEQAGWIASAYMSGQLLVSLALPLIGLSRLGMLQAGAAALLLALLPWLSPLASSPLLVSAWFLVGVASGALQFLGATAAASARNKSAAFGLRLCAILLASGAAIALLGWGSGFSGYGTLAWQTSALLALLATAGLALYRPPPAGLAPRPAAVLSAPGLWGAMVAVFLVFAAQPGFWAYAVYSAQSRGIDLDGLALAIALSKILSALLLLAAIRRPAPAIGGLLKPGLVVACGILAMNAATSLALFVAGVLLWELALNLLSVRFQAAVVHHVGAASGAWLAATIFLGAAIGPLLHGWALRAQAQPVFIAFACACALVPFAWSLLRLPGFRALRIG